MQFKLVCIFIGWVFKWFSSGPRRPNFDPLGVQMNENSWNLWFPTIIWKINHSIHFILAVSIYWVRLQTQFDLGQHQWNSDPPVAKILLQFVVSNHYLENSDQIHFNYGLAQIRSSGCQKWLKWLKLVVFLNWKTIRVKLGMYIYRVSLQKLFEFRPCCPKFVPLVAKIYLN